MRQQNQNPPRGRYEMFAQSTGWQVISQILFWASIVLATTLLIATPIPIHTNFFLWTVFLSNAPSIAALIMGTMGTYLARAVPLLFNPTAQERREMRQRRLGGFLGAIVYASIALTPLTLLFLGLDLYGGFWLASLAVVWFYPFQQATQQRKNFVLSWWQNWPGVVLFILKGLSLFGKLTPEEKLVARIDLRLKAQQRDRWYKRMPNAFYYIAPYVLLAFSGWIVWYSGTLFHSSYGYPNPSVQQVTYLTAVSVATGLGFGWIAFTITTLVLWWTRVGFPFSGENLLGFHRTLFVTLVSIIPGPFSQVLGFAMVALCSKGMESQQTAALFVVYSQFGGNIILLLPYAAQALGMKKAN